jgi:hypothetical protein
LLVLVNESVILIASFTFIILSPLLSYNMDPASCQACSLELAAWGLLLAASVLQRISYSWPGSRLVRCHGPL